MIVAPQPPRYSENRQGQQTLDHLKQSGAFDPALISPLEGLLAAQATIADQKFQPEKADGLIAQARAAAVEQIAGTFAARAKEATVERDRTIGPINAEILAAQKPALLQSGNTETSDAFRARLVQQQVSEMRETSRATRRAALAAADVTLIASSDDVDLIGELANDALASGDDASATRVLAAAKARLRILAAEYAKTHGDSSQGPFERAHLDVSNRLAQHRQSVQARDPKTRLAKAEDALKMRLQKLRADAEGVASTFGLDKALKQYLDRLVNS